jgi:hypothetical protein
MVGSLARQRQGFEHHPLHRCLVAEPSHGVQHFQAGQPARGVVVRSDAFGVMSQDSLPSGETYNSNAWRRVFHQLHVATCCAAICKSPLGHAVSRLGMVVSI